MEWGKACGPSEMRALGSGLVEKMGWFNSQEIRDFREGMRWTWGWLLLLSLWGPWVQGILPTPGVSYCSSLGWYLFFISGPNPRTSAVLCITYARICGPARPKPPCWLWLCGLYQFLLWQLISIFFWVIENLGVVGSTGGGRKQASMGGGR